MVTAPLGHRLLAGFSGENRGEFAGLHLERCSADRDNAAALPAGNPGVLGPCSARPRHLSGLRRQTGYCHARACFGPRAHLWGEGRPDPPGLRPAVGPRDGPHRTYHREVLDDATWGTFEASWRGCVGADADHL